MIQNLEENHCIQLLSSNYIGHLGFISNNWPYVLPITYHYDQTKNSIIGYSGEGHKLNALRKNNSVSLEVSEINSVNKWKSIMIQGTFEELKGIDAKAQLHEFAIGVKRLMSEKGKKEYHFLHEFSGNSNTLGIAKVFRIKVLDITGKRRLS